MFDTIVYIPTILAYAFISLLLAILFFIVIYVSHKVYLSVYDNLPSSVLEEMSKENLDAGNSSSHSNDLSALNSRERKLQTVGLPGKRTSVRDSEPSARSSKKIRGIVPPGSSSNTDDNSSIEHENLDTYPTKRSTKYIDARSPTVRQSTRDSVSGYSNAESLLVKYYDRLTSIPHGKVMQRC